MRERPQANRSKKSLRKLPAPVVVAAVLLAPLIMMAVLRAAPQWDVDLAAFWIHFQVVSFTSLVALVLGILITSLTRSVEHVRTLFVTLAFTAIAGVFLIHGVATPGVLFSAPNPHAAHTAPLPATPTPEPEDEYSEPGASDATSARSATIGLDPNMAVTWSSPISLFAGALLFTLAIMPWSGAAQQWILNRRLWLWWLGALLYGVYVVVAFVAPEPLMQLSRLSPSSLYSLAGFTVLLYVGAALYFGNRYRHDGRPYEAAFAIAAVLLGEAVIAMATMPIWHLSWWMYHGLMLLAFIIAIGAVVLEYERVRHFELTRYFAAISVVATALLALVAGDLATRLFGPLVVPDQINQVRWGTSGIFIGMAALLFLILLQVVRRGDQLIAERTLALQKQQAALERGRLAEALVPIGLAMGASLDLDRVLNIICEESLRLFDVDAAFLWLREGEELVGRAGRGHKREEFVGLRQPLSDGNLLAARVVHERQPLLVNRAQSEQRLSRALVQRFDVRAILGVPFLTGAEAVGALMLIDTQSDERFAPLDLEVATIFGQQAAMALTHARLYATIKRQLFELTTLLSISTALRQATSPEGVMETLFNQMVETLGIVGGAVHVVELARDEVSVPVAVGIMSSMRGWRYPFSGSLSAHVLETREPDLSLDLSADPRFPPAVRALSAQGQRGLTMPMHAGGVSVGTLSMTFPPSHTPTDDELRLIRTIAQIGGIAIHRVSLHEKTEQQAQALATALSDLRVSYQATLTALSAALDARDRETEGHSQRVTAYALVLAEALGVSDQAMRESIEWGALLHDVGKIGVPDAILLKPGRLTDAEWEIMRRHPAIGHHILSDISFLQRALAVVLCHHERWDGSGYPRGLSGEAIPLPARIFAIADTLDAITTTRPYRIARSFAEARGEIIRQRGTQFDPTIVDVFTTIPQSVWERVAQGITSATTTIEA